MKKRLLSCLLVLSALLAADKASAQCSSTITSNTTGICVNDSITFQAQPTGQQSYEWFVDGISQGLGSSFYWSVMNTPGTYTIHCVVTDNNSCVSTSNAITVTVNNAPTLTVGNNGPLCAGSTLNLTAGGTGTTFSWWGPAGFTSTSQNPSITNAQPLNSGTYTVQASNGGCSTYGSTSVSIMSTTPTVTANTGNNNFCSGDSLQLIATTVGLTNMTYSWTGPNSFSSTQANPTIYPSSTANSGTYTLTVTGTGCSGVVTLTDQITVTIDQTPTVTAASNSPVCIGNTINLTGTVSVGTYNWTGPNAFTSTTLSPSITNAQQVNAGTYTLHVVNGGCSANSSTYVAVQGGTPSVTAYATGNLCSNDSVMVYATISNITGASYSWTGPNSFSSTLQYNTIMYGTSQNAGTYTVAVTGNSCSGPVNLTATATLSSAPCDSVWPGDADNGYTVNNWDFLNVGLAYGQTGPARTGASTNWVAQYCADWSGTFNNTNLNHKYADCNGNGTVDGADSAAISLNYGSWHNKGEHTPQAKNTAFPDLYFDMTGIIFAAGSTVTVPIKLGTTTTNMQNLYGLATQIHVSGITPSAPLVINPTTTWIGNTTNSMNFSKSVSNNQTDWAFSRTNHTNTSGDGTIATVTIQVPAGTEYQTVQLYFAQTKMVNKDGDVLTDYNEVDGGALVFPLSVNTAGILVNAATIVPNPSESQATLQLSLTEAGKVNIAVTDITGRNVWSTITNGIAGTQHISLPASELAPGLYTIQVRNDKGEMAQSLKWVRK